MKKTLLFTSLAIMLMALCVTFTSCSDDDDSSPSKLSEVLIGSWVRNRDAEDTNDKNWSAGNMKDVEEYDVITFKSDGTYTWTAYWNNGKSSESDSGKYSVNDETKTIYFDDNRFGYVIGSMSSNTIVFSEYSGELLDADEYLCWKKK